MAGAKGHLDRPDIISALFPQLSLQFTSTFRLALMAGVATVALLVMTAMTGAAVLAGAACSRP